MFRTRFPNYCKCTQCDPENGSGLHRVHPREVCIGMPATYYTDGNAYPAVVKEIDFQDQARRIYSELRAEVIGWKDLKRFKISRDSVYGVRLSSLGHHGHLEVGHSFYFIKVRHEEIEENPDSQT